MSLHVVFGGNQTVVDQNVSEIPRNMSMVHEAGNAQVFVLCVWLLFINLLSLFGVIYHHLSLDESHKNTSSTQQTNKQFSHNR